MKNTPNPYPQARWLWIGKHILFYTAILTNTIFICLLTPFFIFFPYRIRFLLGRLWSFVAIQLLKILFQLDYRITGLEHLKDVPPKQPALILSNHQSAWETMVFPFIFPPHSCAVKRELFWIPFYGWLLWFFENMSIHRQKSGSLPQLLKQGKKLFQKNAWILIFPQGTRVMPGEQKRYSKGGAVLACDNQVPVVPVAHNSGFFWPKGWMLTHSGTVEIHIGPIIKTTPEMTPEQLNQKASQWIEKTVLELDSHTHSI